MTTTIYTVYKITNIINNKIYIGSHKQLDNEALYKYMGSGIQIGHAIKKYGKSNFNKEILYTFNNEKDMFDKEEYIVNEKFVKRLDTYNIITGGSSGQDNLKGIAVKDKNGKCFNIDKDDPRWLSGEIHGVAKDTITVKDINGNTMRVSKNDPRWLSGELVGATTGKVMVVCRETGKILQVDKSESNLYDSMNKGKVVVRDINTGETSSVSINNIDYISGKLIPVLTGHKGNRGTSAGNFSGYYVYKNKKYDRGIVLAKELHTVRSSIMNWCKYHNSKVITEASFSRSKFLQSLGKEIVGKTFNDLGFDFEPI